MSGRKSKNQIKSEQHLSTIAGSWKLKNYGNTIKEDDYIEYYTVDFEDDINVGYIQNKCSVTKNMGDFNSVTFSSSISLPFIFDPKDPESKDNKGRFEHVCLLLDNMLESSLGKNKALLMEEFGK